jgi:hypothetical protein
MIIDFHTHIFPDHLAENALNFLSEKGKISPFTDGTLNGLLESMEKSGVDVSVICNIATSPKQSDNIFNFCKKIRSDKILPLGSIHPESENIEEYLKKYKSEGVKGLKLHPDYQNFYIDDKAVFYIYDLCESFNLFIVFHCGIDIGYPPPYHATPERIKKIRENFKNLKIVAAHMGSFEMYDEVEEYLFGEDIYFDTAYCLDKMPQEDIKKFFGKHPIERFLFATDSPWCNQKNYVEILSSFKFLTDDDKEKIFSENAKKLLNIT